MNEDFREIDREIETLEKSLKEMKLSHGSVQDGDVKVEVEDKMKVYITLIPPKAGGKEIEFEQVISTLEREGIKEGIDEEKLRIALQKRIYNKPILVTEGTPPTNGKDAYFSYRIGEGEEKVDVEPGQLIALKVPATQGVAGRTVYGDSLPPNPGKEIEIIAGKNVTLSKDGNRVYATDYGRVIWEGERVSVERIHEIMGDVDFRIGNIDFEGKVLIHGSVEDGFSVKASGDIEVRGGVGKAFLEAGGNIRVSHGIMGGGEAEIKAGGDIVAKFVREADLRARGSVVISDSIIDSTVTAGRKVVVQGREGLIVGGEIFAGEEVDAKVIGGKEVAPTKIKVGGMPGVIKQLNALGKIKEKYERKLEDVERGIKFLSEEEKLNVKRDLERKLKVLREKESYLLSKKSGRVSVREIIHPKVKMKIGSMMLQLKKSYKHVTFFVESDKVKVAPYKSHEEKVGSCSRKKPLEKSLPQKTFVMVSASSTEAGKKLGAELLGLPLEEVDCREIPQNIKGAKYMLRLKVFQKGEAPADRGKEGKIDEKEFQFFESRLEELEQSLKKMSWKHDSKLDGKVELKIEDGLKAYLTITPPQIGGKRVGFEDIRNALMKKRIVGVNDELIRKILKEKKFNTPILIAKGIPPTKGEDARFLYQFGARKGKVEYAIPGQLLMYKIPPSNGKPGISVTGERIEAERGKDIRIIPGKNVVFSPDGTRAYATAEGAVFWNSGRLSVERLFEIEGDATKDIQFDGKVIVNGSIKEDVRIVGEGDVEIRGDVEKGMIASASNIIINGKIGDGVKVSAAGDIMAESVEGAKLKANGNVIVDGTLDGCEVVAEKKVVAKDSIVGGEIICEEVDAKVIGSFSGTITKIKAKRRVSASDTLHFGVKMIVGEREVPIKRMRKYTSFELEESGRVREKEYVASKILRSGEKCQVVRIESKLPPPSVVVETSSLDEGKRMGAHLLDIDEITYEVLDRTDEGFVLRVFPISSSSTSSSL